MEDKIKEVENGLIPLVPVTDFAGWNILDRMKHHQVQGLSIAVIHDYQVAWAKSYGLADTALQVPMTTDILLSAGSISKLVMSAGAMKLVEEGILSLDSPINDFLKSWELGENTFTKDNAVTLRMLLSHTGGTSQSAYFGYEANLAQYPTLVEILDGRAPDGTRKVVVNRVPGLGFQYSGGGSLIAQLAMMDATGSEFEPLLRKLIFDPLGMSAATFEQPLSQKYAKKASWGYQDAVWFKGTPYVYPQLAAAGLYATPRDLAKFIVEIQLALQGKGKILSQSSAREMMKPQALFQEGNNTKEEIGVGPFLLQRPNNTEPRGKYFFFDGANAGFNATAIGSIEEGYGVVVMVNSGNDFNGLHKEVVRSVAQAYQWFNFLPEAIKPVRLSEDTLKSYSGRFQKNEDEVVTIEVEESHLIVKYNDSKAIYTFPVAKDTVVLTDYNIRGWFSRDHQGDVIGFQNEYQEAPMPRMKEGEYTLFELFQLGKLEEAKNRLRLKTMNESQITYLAYENTKKPEVAKAILEVALEKFPSSGIVWERWGDYYLSTGNQEKAIESFNQSLKYEPLNDELKKKLKAIQ